MCNTYLLLKCTHTFTCKFSTQVSDICSRSVSPKPRSSAISTFIYFHIRRSSIARRMETAIREIIYRQCGNTSLVRKCTVIFLKIHPVLSKFCCHSVSPTTRSRAIPIFAFIFTIENLLLEKFTTQQCAKNSKTVW